MRIALSPRIFEAADRDDVVLLEYPLVKRPFISIIHVRDLTPELRLVYRQLTPYVVSSVEEGLRVLDQLDALLKENYRE
jgi:hypothetical protein